MVPVQASAQESSGRRIGKYEVLGELGHGGMAIVYRARDTQLLRDVAVKVLHPHLANDPESRVRFLREARAAARLRHPNIVEVYDFSVETDRDSFMVTELLEGPTLRRFAELHPGMPAEIVAAIGVVLCEALACAHGQGVIHRDVKPDNILLQTGGVLKLTDFGIAHVADGNGMTVTGQVLGSPAHMAPEQIEGRHIDARADLFAAGTVLYVLAVGRLPFEAPSPHALLRKILDAEYPDPLRIAPVVGHRLAAIIAKCLERDPNDRYADAGELKRALLEFVAELDWSTVDAPLKKYFEDPESFGRAHRALLLERLPELGVRARKAGKLPDALGYFNRALALEAGNLRVLSLVRGISRRRRATRVLTALAIVAGAGVVSSAAVIGLSRALAKPHLARLQPPQWNVTTPTVQTMPSAAIVTAAVVPQPAPVAQPTVALAPRAGVPTTAAHRPTVALHPVQLHAQPVESTSPPAVREVFINVRYAPGTHWRVDSGEMRPWLRAVTLSLPVGHHTLYLEKDSGECRPNTFSFDVIAGDGEQAVVESFDCGNVQGSAQHAP